MRALSVQQPFAWLICVNLKDIENRSWALPIGFTLPQRIYIHASKTFDAYGYDWVCANTELPYNTRVAILERSWDTRGPDFGAIIGEVDIVDSKYRFPDENANFYSVWHEPGKYGFVLRNARLYSEPIPYRGYLKFFEVKL